jgi:hypothetical protein
MGSVILYSYHGYHFTWDVEKAEKNVKKHGIAFEEACQAVINPIQLVEEASHEEEERWGIVSYTLSERLAFPIYVVVADAAEEGWRIISARKATPAERSRYEEEIGSH